MRAHWTKRSMGSRSLPKVVLVARRRAPRRRAGSAFTTAFRSPRTPCPLLLKTGRHARPRRPALGLLVTRRWISCRPMKGADVGVVEEGVERGLQSAGAAVLPAGMVTPRKVLPPVEWRLALTPWARRMWSGRLGGHLAVSKSQPVNTRARSVMSAWV